MLPMPTDNKAGYTAAKVACGWAGARGGKRGGGHPQKKMKSSSKMKSREKCPS